MRLFIALFLAVFSLYSKTINVAVAANVSYAIDELIKEFNKNSNLEVKTTISSSGKLTAQIIHGAPIDLFLSADIKYPNFLYKNGFNKFKPTIYAKGLLILATTKDINLTSIDSLLDKNISKIAMANPKSAPYGKAAKEALVNAKIYNRVKNRLIFGESISQTVIFTLNATDAGFIAKSAIFSPKLKSKKIKWIDIDKRLYSPINQAMILLNSSALEFYNFLQSPKAKEIFKKYGYIVQ